MKQEYKIGKLIAVMTNGFTEEYKVCRIDSVDSGRYGFVSYQDKAHGLGSVYVDFYDGVVVPKSNYKRGQELTKQEFWALFDERPGHIPPGELANYGARK